MRALAILVACTFSFGALAHPAAIGHPLARPNASRPIARPDHRFGPGGFSYFGTTAVGVYPSESPDEEPVREEYFPEYYPQQPEPRFERRVRAPAGPQILYIGKLHARMPNTVRVIYGTE